MSTLEAYSGCPSAASQALPDSRATEDGHGAATAFEKQDIPQIPHSRLGPEFGGWSHGTRFGRHRIATRCWVGTRKPQRGARGGIAIGTWRFVADWLWLIGGVENQRFDPRDPFVQFVDLAIQGFNLRCHPIVKAADAGLNGGKLSEHQASEDKADGNDRYPILHGRIIPESGTGGSRSGYVSGWIFRSARRMRAISLRMATEESTAFSQTEASKGDCSMTFSGRLSARLYESKWMPQLPLIREASAVGSRPRRFPRTWETRSG